MGGLSSAEREELTRLRRANRRLKGGARSSHKPRPGSPRKAVLRSPLRVREGEPGHPLGGVDVPTAGGFQKRVLRLGGSTDV